MYSNVRIEKDLYEMIAKIAEKEKRSITKQIEYMLKQYILILYKK